MIPITLFGTTTSPFVRRIRAYAHERDLPITLISTATDEGQAKLREVTPVWKVPTAIIDGRMVIDSRNIMEVLVSQHGLGALRPVGDRIEETNLTNIIDEALLSCIHNFYLRQDGVDISGIARCQKQVARVKAALDFLESKVTAHGLTSEQGFGLTELTLYTTLDWMRFRQVVDLAAYPKLVAFLKHHASRPSLVATVPIV